MLPGLPHGVLRAHGGAFNLVQAKVMELTCTMALTPHQEATWAEDG